MLPESRRIAALLMQRPSDAEWDHAIKVENILQKGAASTAVRQARLIRFRLARLGPAALPLVAQGEGQVATQTLLAAALLHSALFHDFVRDVLIPHHRRLDVVLQVSAWDAFLADCAAREPAVAAWTAVTQAKLLQVILRMLVEARYLDSSRSLRLRAPQLCPEVRWLLQDLRQDALIHTMELQA